jgi:hypothetical protein
VQWQDVAIANSFVRKQGPTILNQAVQLKMNEPHSHEKQHPSQKKEEKRRKNPDQP